MPAPLKIQTGLCLSHHPSSPPDDVEIARIASRGRAIVSSS